MGNQHSEIYPNRIYLPLQPGVCCKSDTIGRSNLGLLLNLIPEDELNQKLDAALSIIHKHNKLVMSG